MREVEVESLNIVKVWLILQLKIYDIFIGLGTGEGSGRNSVTHRQGVWLILWLKI